MITRRAIVAVGLAGLPALAARPARAAARLSEDGLYQMDWYHESFLDLAEDQRTAGEQGKRFAVLWGLRNCPACRVMHRDYLADPAIEAFIRERFLVLHLNILGAREVTDFDGSRLSEKALAARYGIEGTPAIQFFPASAEALATLPPRAREADRMAGLPPRAEFLAMFRRLAPGAAPDKPAPVR